ncbi:transportin 1 [Carpediemonas membranifera]|uniref:Transportin 1 n=1 Tax=Carpediemonas membranifera TaxID=201153 RepID=A0A8J6B4V0_9EUKA|nr:transportin 1 [Carpediemonas membranifera]|eukprot:KAG9390072.1 transportin 1 [Carpediemonas membranifera]
MELRNQVLELIKNAQSPDPSVQRGVYSQFHDHIVQVPNLPDCLLSILCEESLDRPTRQMAGILLKNNFSQIVEKAPQTAVRIGEQTLPLIGDSDNSIRHVACSIVSRLVRELPTIDTWGSLIPTIRQMIGSEGYHVIGALETVLYIAEDDPWKLPGNGESPSDSASFSDLISDMVSLVGPPAPGNSDFSMACLTVTLRAISELWGSLSSHPRINLPDLLARVLSLVQNILNLSEELVRAVADLLTMFADHKASLLFPLARPDTPNALPSLVHAMSAVIAHTDFSEGTRRAACTFLDGLTLDKNITVTNAMADPGRGNVLEAVQGAAFNLCGAVVYSADDRADIQMVLAREQQSVGKVGVVYVSEETEDAAVILRKTAAEALEGLVRAWPSELGGAVYDIAKRFMRATWSNGVHLDGITPPSLLADVDQDELWAVHEGGILLMGLFFRSIDNRMARGLPADELDGLFAALTAMIGGTEHHPHVQSVACWTLGAISTGRHRDAAFVNTIIETATTMAMASKYAKAQRGAVSLISVVTDTAKELMTPYVPQLCALFAHGLQHWGNYALPPLSDAMSNVFEATGRRITTQEAKDGVSAVFAAIGRRISETVSEDGTEIIPLVETMAVSAPALIAAVPGIASSLPGLFGVCMQIVGKNLTPDGVPTNVSVIRDAVNSLTSAIEAAGAGLPDMADIDAVVGLVDTLCLSGYSVLQADALMVLSAVFEFCPAHAETTARSAFASGKTPAFVSTVVQGLKDSYEMPLDMLVSVTYFVFIAFSRNLTGVLPPEAPDAAVTAIEEILRDPTPDVLVNAGLALLAVVAFTATRTEDALTVFATNFADITSEVIHGTASDQRHYLGLLMHVFSAHSKTLLSMYDVTDNIQMVLQLIQATDMDAELSAQAGGFVQFIRGFVESTGRRWDVWTRTVGLDGFA